MLSTETAADTKYAGSDGSDCGPMYCAFASNRQRWELTAGTNTINSTQGHYTNTSTMQGHGHGQDGNKKGPTTSNLVPSQWPKELADVAPCKSTSRVVHRPQLQEYWPLFEVITLSHNEIIYSSYLCYRYSCRNIWSRLWIFIRWDVYNLDIDGHFN